MLSQTVLELLQDYSYLLLLLCIALLGFSAGLWQAPPLISPRIAQRADCDADYRTSKHLGSGQPARIQQGEGEIELRMSTSNGSRHGNTDAKEQKEKTHVKQGKTKPIKVGEVGLRRRITQESNPRSGWMRSFSLRNRRPTTNETTQDSIPKRASEERKTVVERKASLTGEEVKELADAFIARMQKRMWVQRQESLKRHSNSPVGYGAPPSP